jgi:DNA-binding response OmpR family regulator
MSLPSSPPPGAKYRILVVEDDQNIARLVMANLTKAGFECRHAPDGLSGLAAFQSSQPHLVILDLMMPGMNGRDLCAKIRETSTVPVIMMTALDQDEDQVSGFKVGADDYVPKPFNPKLLVARAVAQLRRVYRYDADAKEAKAQAEDARRAAREKSAQERLPPGWGMCDSCKYMGPTSEFKSLVTGQSRTKCPHCGRSEYISFSIG